MGTWFLWAGCPLCAHLWRASVHKLRTCQCSALIMLVTSGRFSDSCTLIVARGSWLVARGSWLVARGVSLNRPLPRFCPHISRATTSLPKGPDPAGKAYARRGVRYVPRDSETQTKPRTLRRRPFFDSSSPQDGDTLGFGTELGRTLTWRPVKLSILRANRRHLLGQWEPGTQMPAVLLVSQGLLACGADAPWPYYGTSLSWKFGCRGAVQEVGLDRTHV